MGIHFFQDNSEYKPREENKLKGWILQVIAFNEQNADEINIIFTDSKSIQDLNKTYLRHNKPTDVIAFDYSDENGLSGDIYICPEVVNENSLYFRTGLEEEIMRVIIHGVLHLAGYNDKTEKEQSIMREKENEALQMYKDR